MEKPNMPRLNFRLPAELLEAAEAMAAAEGLSVGTWARNVIAEKTGVQIDVKKGLAGSSAKTRERVSSLGGNGKAEAFRKASKKRAKKTG